MEDFLNTVLGESKLNGPSQCLSSEVRSCECKVLWSNSMVTRADMSLQKRSNGSSFYAPWTKTEVERQ